jgi:hypothetical protein
MSDETRFPRGTDDELAGMLKPHFEGPDPGAFLRRLEGRLRALPERDTEWEVLARWARPSVLTAAMAAGFLLGLVWWRGWSRPVTQPAVPAVSVAALEAPRTAVSEPVFYAVLEGR